jgi:hypothetical protein
VVFIHFLFVFSCRENGIVMTMNTPLRMLCIIHSNETCAQGRRMARVETKDVEILNVTIPNNKCNSRNCSLDLSACVL